MADTGTGKGGASGGSQAARVPTGQSIRPANVSRWNRTQFAGITPDRLFSVLKSAERGQTEAWADLAEFMLRTDPQLKSVYETRILGVASAELVFHPGRGDEAQAEAAAEFCERSFDMVDRLEETIKHILHGDGIGWSLLEHDWRNVAGEWHSIRQRAIPARDTAFSADWSLSARTFPKDDKGNQLSAKWVATDAEPARWITHIPASIGTTPNVSGDLMSVAWYWLFKRWLITNRQDGLERFAGPLLIGKVPANATKSVRETLLEGLENLSSDHVAVLEIENAIEIIEAGKGSDAWTGAIDWFDAQMTKGVLGSALNVDAGSIGSRALGESQADMTIMPRLTSCAKAVESTIERCWLRPLLRFNAHRFGGMPPVPRVEFRLIQEEPPEVDQLVIDAGAVTVDEVRQSRGLEPWGAEKGGDRLVVPIAKSNPGFSREEAPGVAPPAPFSKRAPRAPTQMALPLTTRRPSKTSQTSSTSPTQIETVPFEPSGGPEN